MSEGAIMSKQTASRHAHAPRTRRREKPVHRRNATSKMMPPTVIGKVEFKPTVVDFVEVDFLNDPDEVLADHRLVTGFEDEDL
jgi:hypothetical protein